MKKKTNQVTTKWEKITLILYRASMAKTSKTIKKKLGYIQKNSQIYFLSQPLSHIKKTLIPMETNTHPPKHMESFL